MRKKLHPTAMDAAILRVLENAGGTINSTTELMRALRYRPSTVRAYFPVQIQSSLERLSKKGEIRYDYQYRFNQRPAHLLTVTLLKGPKLKERKAKPEMRELNIAVENLLEVVGKIVRAQVEAEEKERRVQMELDYKKKLAAWKAEQEERCHEEAMMKDQKWLKKIFGV